MPTPRAAAVHDLSGFGRCSLTVALPVLSAMGVQCCPLPTALLSTHTGGFSGFSFLDLTGEMERFARHWRTLGLTFSAVYTGFLGSERQIGLVRDFIRQFRAPSGLAVVDPVMGDGGALYQTYTPALCAGMRLLAAEADVITPNRTEAALLLDVPYGALPGDRETVRRLSLGGRRSVVLTGAGDGMETGAVCFDAASGEVFELLAPRTPGEFCGAGDVFASVLTGALCRGWELPRAARLAVDFTAACVRRSAAGGAPAREGLDFEPLLGPLARAAETQRPLTVR